MNEYFLQFASLGRRYPSPRSGHPVEAGSGRLPDDGLRGRWPHLHARWAWGSISRKPCPAAPDCSVGDNGRRDGGQSDPVSAGPC